MGRLAREERSEEGGGYDSLSDVAVDEDVAWDGGCDDGLGDARVGAPQPEDLLHGPSISSVLTVPLGLYVRYAPWAAGLLRGGGRSQGGTESPRLPIARSS